MAKKIRKLKIKSNRKYGNVGDSPGMIHIDENAMKPVLRLYSYNQQEVQQSDGSNFESVLQQLDVCTNHTHWLRVNGLGDQNLLEQIGTHFGVNRLVLEDIVNTHQRPKFDDYDNYFFVTSRLITYHEDELSNCQVSFFVKDNLIISFQEDYSNTFEMIVKRLIGGKGLIRTAGPAYLCYAMMDTIFDLYFSLLNNLGDMLDDIEDRLYENPDKSIMYDSQKVKRTMIMLRRAIWPERDKVNEMIREDIPLINKDVKVFLRDAYDHCIQIIDMIESYQEITSSIIDVYLSIVSNRMNEIMKVLTLISVIFMPITFIVGVFGMNFARQDPVTNKVLPENMPELYSPHGYTYCLIAMFVITIAQILFFWKKGWFNRL
ncbi:magnesium/cobalt transporter CorA [Mucilaginibacter paludis]|uniref:Magnesium transport protein CorA n=1 Tax=Mucilaginibacter paludis DSM 18603 TaxID=714943 RepID=H1Y0M6_9SPHI|nr:magnesium/cobalt transporter CorA [Mucilaginibacter paludis]EHQ28766.1 magnesium and cobalt transport protein CorA [Mucilaginibacter paludis DSM 18603]